MDRLILRQKEILSQTERGIEPVLYWDAESKQFTLEFLPVYFGTEKGSKVQNYLDTHKGSVVIQSIGCAYNSYNTIFEDISNKEVRQLFAEQIGLNMKELYQYILGPSDLEKANAIELQNYIHPSIETTLEDDGYLMVAANHIRAEEVPEEIKAKIIYKDTSSLIFAKKDDKRELYFEYYDKHHGYISKEIATGEQAKEIFKQIRPHSLGPDLSKFCK